MLECLIGLDPFRRVDLEAPHYEVLELTVVLLPVSVPEGYGPGSVAIIEELSRLVGCAHLIEHHAEGPHVDLGTYQGVLGAHFGSDIAACATPRGHQRFAAAWVHDVRETEIAYFEGRIVFVVFVPLQQCVLEL